MKGRVEYRAYDVRESKMFFSDINSEVNDDSREFYPLCFWIGYKGAKELILSEYIGLKDRNQKKIYEGDIVKFRSHPSKEIIGEVYYCNEKARFEIKSADEFEKAKGTWSISNFSHITYVEVIGNIYENAMFSVGL